jgi:peptidoglycan/LPS O-acetylase OafA/YrhL
MKRAILLFIIAGMVIVSVIIWQLNGFSEFNSADILHAANIILLVAFAMFVGYKRLTSAKRNEPTEDEMSKKILQKTASLSYYISLYLWVFLLFIKDRITFDTEELIGIGILGMAITFAVVWMFVNFRGIRNE